MLRYVGPLVVVACCALTVGCVKKQEDPIEQSIKDKLKERFGSEITEVVLHSRSDGTRTGSATAADGSRYDLSIDPPVGDRVEWKAVATQATVELRLREQIKTQLRSDPAVIELRELIHHGYEGTATFANGDVYDVDIDPPTLHKGESRVIPGPAMVERMVRQGIDEKNESKVKTVTLEKRSPGNYTGTAVLGNGVQFRVWTRNEGQNFSWQAEPVRE